MRRRNKTRKAGKYLSDEDAIFIVPPPPPEPVPMYWDRFLVEGDALFDYMIHNLESMYNDEIINDFFIIEGFRWLLSEANILDEKYNTEIQPHLIRWIINEHNTQRLFNKDYWKPFRDLTNFSSMHYGYKIMYEYKNYYFQLGLINDCNTNGEHCVHFILALFGWGNETDESIKKNIMNDLPMDKIMPEQYWKRK